MSLILICDMILYDSFTDSSSVQRDVFRITEKLSEERRFCGPALKISWTVSARRGPFPCIETLIPLIDTLDEVCLICFRAIFIAGDTDRLNIGVSQCSCVPWFLGMVPKFAI